VNYISGILGSLVYTPRVQTTMESLCRASLFLLFAVFVQVCPWFDC